MNATAGDRLIIKGHRLGEHGRDALILDVRGEGGGPPFLVRWDEDGHESLVFPGSDAEIHHYPGGPLVRTRAGAPPAARR